MRRGERQQHQQQQHTAAAAAAEAEAGNGPARNCGTANVVSTAAVIWQEEHIHYLGKVNKTDDRLSVFTHAGNTNSSSGGGGGRGGGTGGLAVALEELRRQRCGIAAVGAKVSTEYDTMIKIH